MGFERLTECGSIILALHLVDSLHDERTCNVDETRTARRKRIGRMERSPGYFSTIVLIYDPYSHEYPASHPTDQ
eukprot:scaffold183198_cov43-Attheya_sp.AAC.2